MNTKNAKNNKNYFWSFCPLDFYDCIEMTNEQAGKIFKTVLGQLIKNDVPESSMAYPMYARTLDYREKKKMAANKRWREHFNKYNDQETATTPQPENEEAVATSPSRGGSAANSYAQALDMPGSDKASDQASSNTGITPPVVSRESGKFKVTTKKPSGSPPPQCVIDAQKKAAARKAQSGKRVKPSKPKDREDFKQFVFEANLHIAIAEDWYAIHEKRGWKFQDGTPINDWRAALTAYVHSREKANK